MAEKYYDFQIDHPLTAARRTRIDDYIARNAHLYPSGISHEWEKAPKNVLHLSTPPAKWEVKFSEDHVEVWGSAPFWARALFTKDKKRELQEQLEDLLLQTGFVEEEENTAKAAGSGKKKKTA